jgi:hypothetical protein
VINWIAFFIVGYLIAKVLFTILLLHIEIEPGVLMILTLILIYIILGILVYFLKGLLQILSTSFFGSYAIIRGISLIKGGFPEDEYISGLIKYKEIYQLKKILLHESLFYTILLVIILTISIIIQFYTYIDESNEIKRKKSKKRN